MTHPSPATGDPSVPAAQDEVASLRARVAELERQLDDRRGRDASDATDAGRAGTNDWLVQLLVSQVPAVVWTTDRALRFTSSRGGALRGLGLAPDEVVGRTVAEFRQDPLAAVTLDAHRRALAGESVVYDDWFGDRVYRSRIEPLRDPQGETIGCIGIAHDVTDMRQAERALRVLNAELEHRVAERTAELQKSEALFRGVSEQMPDILLLIDLEDPATPAKIIHANEAAGRALDCLPGELIGRSVLDLEDEKTRTGAASRLPRLQRGETLVFEGHLVRPDGGLLPLEAGVRGIQGCGRRLAIAVCRDLTARRETEKRLRLVQSAVEHVADAVTITDADLGPPGPRIIYVNPAFEQMTGYHRDELVGKTPRLLQGPRTSRHILDRLRDRLQAGKSFHGETFNYRKDGSEYISEWHVTPVLNEQGQVANYVAIQRDVTAQRRAEELADQRRAELAHVARLNSMGEMASGLAHELNQPLAAIANYARGCLRRMDSGQIQPPQIREALDRMATQAQRAAQIIQRLRRFVGKREPRPAVTNLNDLILDAIALAEVEIRQRQMHVVYDLANNLPDVCCDAIQIEQVILNLVRNGMDAMAMLPPPERILTLTTSLSGAEVELCVSDRGPGLTEQQMHRMFDPFFSTKPHGMGMGLTISQTIAEAHGGKLRATRNSDRGLSLRLTLPPATREREAEASRCD